MNKSEVYSWRIAPYLKNALEQRARAEGTSLSRLLDRIATEWLEKRPEAAQEEEKQRRLQQAAAKCFGSLEGGDPHLAEQSSQRLKKIIREQHEGEWTG